jgi:chromosome segregation ATPase
MVDGSEDDSLDLPDDPYETFSDEEGGVAEEEIPSKNESFKEEASNRERISSLATSMRVVEDRYNTLRKKLQMTDDELIEAQQSFEKERKVLDEQILECKERIRELESDVKEMKEEITKAVHRRDFRYLKKYVDYWDPSRFITRDEAQSLLDDDGTQNG